MLVQHPFFPALFSSSEEEEPVKCKMRLTPANARERSQQNAHAQIGMRMWHCLSVSCLWPQPR